MLLTTRDGAPNWTEVIFPAFPLLPILHLLLWMETESSHRQRGCPHRLRPAGSAQGGAGNWSDFLGGEPAEG